jgi:hypothetical protein
MEPVSDDDAEAWSRTMRNLGSAFADDLAHSLSAVTRGIHDVDLTHTGLVSFADGVGKFGAGLVNLASSIGNDLRCPLLRTGDSSLGRAKLPDRRLKVSHLAIVPGQPLGRLVYPLGWPNWLLVIWPSQ